MTEKKTKSLALIEMGSEIAGGAVGGALGFLAGGPAGAAGAGALGVVIAKGANKLLGDFSTRVLSRREEERVGAAAAIALNAIRESLENGKQARDDDFFKEKEGERSSAEEIFEGVLRKSKDEHEEKKVALLGNFYANVAFSNVSVGEANYYLGLIESLTYRQLCVLGLLLFKPHLQPPVILKKDDYSKKNKVMGTFDSLSLLQEVHRLNADGLVACRDGEGENYIALLGWNNIVPDSLELTKLGDRLANLLAPYDHKEDVAKIILLLSDELAITQTMASAPDSAKEPRNS